MVLGRSGILPLIDRQSRERVEGKNKKKSNQIKSNQKGAEEEPRCKLFALVPLAPVIFQPPLGRSPSHRLINLHLFPLLSASPSERL